MAPPVPVPEVSHAVQEICHCLLILIVGFEAVSEASGHLAIVFGRGGQVASLGEDLLLVNVGVVAGHALSRLVWDNSTGSAVGSGVLVCQFPNWSAAATEFVILTHADSQSL